MCIIARLRNPNKYERHGFEWEQKGIHEEHLSVYDYKKKVRSEEVEKLIEEISEKKWDFSQLSARIENSEDGETELEQLEHRLYHGEEYRLSEPSPLMSAMAYKKKLVEPLFDLLKSIAVKLLKEYLKLKSR